jgi:CBS domain-containing protein
MLVSDHCTRDPITAGPGESVQTAAKRMTEFGVGAIVITDDLDRPVGVVTDRDVVQKVLRRRRDAARTSLEQIMSIDIVCVWDRDPLSKAFSRMRQEAVRRVLVADHEGKLAGILSFDDALPLIVEELSLAAGVVRAQLRKERPEAERTGI